MVQGFDILQTPSDLKEDLERAKRFIDEHTDQIDELADVKADKGGDALVWAELKRLREQADAGVPVNGAGIVAPIDDDGDENLEGGALDDYTRWRLDYVSAGGVQVLQGEFIQNGRKMAQEGPINIAADGDSKDGFTTPWAGAATHYVYFEFYNTNVYIDPTLYPENIKIVSSTTPPSDTLMRQQYIMIGTYDTDSTPEVVSGSVVRYRIKDHDRLTVVPDGNLDPEKQYPIKTTQYLTSDLGQLEMYNAHLTELVGTSAIPWTSVHGVPLLYKDGDGGGELNWYGFDSAEDPNYGSINLATDSTIQLYGFDVASPSSSILTSSDFATTQVVGRVGVTPTAVITYLDLSNFVPDYANEVVVAPLHILESHSDYSPDDASKQPATDRIIIAKDANDWQWTDIDAIGGALDAHIESIYQNLSTGGF